ncbi:MAG: C40 family peptidase, partial [Treponema sp.]|nr:C40 family peptidase [Treponema sp.]
MAAFFLAFFLCAAGNTCTAQVSQKRQDFIDYALTLRGIPYKYAGFSKNGLDCSGMVAYAAKYGIRENLPRSASGMWDKCKHLKEEDREPGDLIFFAV